MPRTSNAKSLGVSLPTQYLLHNKRAGKQTRLMQVQIERLKVYFPFIPAELYFIHLLYGTPVLKHCEIYFILEKLSYRSCRVSEATISQSPLLHSAVLYHVRVYVLHDVTQWAVCRASCMRPIKLSQYPDSPNKQVSVRSQT